MGWQLHQLDHRQITCTLLQTDNHASTSSPICFTGQMISGRPTNSVKTLKATTHNGGNQIKSSSAIAEGTCDAFNQLKSVQLNEKSHLTRNIALSCGIKIPPVGSLDQSQSTRVTDGRTDRITTLKPALAQLRRAVIILDHHCIAVMQMQLQCIDGSVDHRWIND